MRAEKTGTGMGPRHGWVQKMDDKEGDEDENHPGGNRSGLADGDRGVLPPGRQAERLSRQRGRHCVNPSVVAAFACSSITET